MEKVIKWTLSTGQQAEVLVELMLSETRNCDGYSYEKKVCNLRIWTELDGETISYDAPQPVTGHAKFVSRLGRIGLDQARHDEIMAAIAEAKATPEWQAKIEAEKKAEKIAEEYYATQCKIDNAMTLNGHTY